MNHVYCSGLVTLVKAGHPGQGWSPWLGLVTLVTLVRSGQIWSGLVILIKAGHSDQDWSLWSGLVTLVNAGHLLSIVVSHTL